MLPVTTQLQLAPLVAAMPGEPRRVLSHVSEAGFRFVQLSATQQGMRPRDLDQSARRDLLAVLRRHELELAGLDVWIPVEHFLDDANVSRAVDATIAAIAMAGDLGRVPLSMILPSARDEDGDGEVEAVLEAVMGAAQQRGVAIADHTAPPRGRLHASMGIGIDPPAYLAQGLDPAATVSAQAEHLVSARISDLNTAGMRCPIGSANGRLDLIAYCIALSVAGYRRPIVADARQWPQPWEGLQSTAERWAQSTGVL